jgi:phosphonate transport system permease protein
VLVLIGALWFTAPIVEVDFVRLIGSFGRMLAFAGQMFVTPDWAYVPQLLTRMLETIEIAILGTAIAIVLSLPMGILAARNATPHIVVYRVTRDVLSLMRALPELVWALVFVSAVGLGPLPGVMVHRGGGSQGGRRGAGARRGLVAGAPVRHAAAGLA